MILSVMQNHNQIDLINSQLLLKIFCSMFANLRISLDTFLF